MNRKIDVKRLTITAIMAAAACVLGPISIPLPISLVPISACTLVFYLFSYLLRARDCAAACLMVFQMSLNVFGSVDILPLTGVTFPFVSTGGSSMVACWALLAFFKAADTRQNASFAIRLERKRKGGDAA